MAHNMYCNQIVIFEIIRKITRCKLFVNEKSIDKPDRYRYNVNTESIETEVITYDKNTCRTDGCSSCLVNAAIAACG